MYVPRATRVDIVFVLADKCKGDVSSILIVEGIEGDASFIGPAPIVTGKLVNSSLT